MSQLLTLLPRHQFDQAVLDFGGDRYAKKFSTWNQLTVLLYAQAANKNSLRDIQTALGTQAPKLYHLGLPAALSRLARETGAESVYFARRFEPEARRQEEAVATKLSGQGIETRAFPGDSLFDPNSVRGREGHPYKVFTPFWNRCGELPPPEKPCGDPGELHGVSPAPHSEQLEDWKLLPEKNWGEGLSEAPQPGEEAAQRDLKKFLTRARGYAANRNFPALEGTSRLSPRLHFGELDVRRVWTQALLLSDPPFQKGGFLGELGWRDFGRHVLFHEPFTPERPHHERFTGFRWRKDSPDLAAWQKGMTGYPMVDAGMRELWVTGLMHNRVRMIAASFLVKDLLIDWREGARWFWNTLVDADLASNTLGWQWSAGCGTDAAPFFRIFNPSEQARRFDAEGNYVRRWVPELSRLDNRWLHAPWTAPQEILKHCGVVLGRDYPEPIVEHAQARTRALMAYGATAWKNAS